MSTKDDHRFSYSVLDLYVVGSRMTDDYDEEAAVNYFLDLHPEANRDAVRKELDQELAKL